MTRQGPELSRRRSIKARFQAAFILLALAAVGVTGYVALMSASGALQEATYDRLTAIRETRRHALQRYFEQLNAQVLALSTSETAVLALEELGRSWSRLEVVADETPLETGLERYYRDALAPRLAPPVDQAAFVRTWLPTDPQVRTLQRFAIAENPHPPGSKDLLVEIPRTGEYAEAHARHHPTFHRYQTAFGFYDIFLIAAPEGRVVYTVQKEIDLGADLTKEPYRSTRLGRLYQRATAAATGTADAVVIEDFAPYAPSAFAPAAFIGAPIRVAGATVGVLAMQIAIREVDRVMTGEQQWADEGQGETGQAYAVGPDGTLRSDLRAYIEDPERFVRRLEGAGAASAVVEALRNARTGVLVLPVEVRSIERVQAGARDLAIGANLLGTPVLRSQAPLGLGDLPWTVVAEIEVDEAFAPVRAMQLRIVLVGVGIGGLFLVVASWLGASITRPVLVLAQSVAQLGAGHRGTTASVSSADEIGALADAFNRMSRDLERTTVSKAELEVLAGRLISAQEDERRRVARELHDDLVQRLAAAAIELGQAEHLPLDGEQRAQSLQRVRRALASLSEDVHRLSRRLHPAVLDELGLVAGVEGECRAFMERGGPAVDLKVTGTFDDLSKPRQLAVYRVVQEALRNVSLHANASDVSLSIRRTSDGVEMSISDDGVGFDRGSSGWKPGLGLASMEERARLLGGVLVVTSSPGRGTALRLTLPWDGADEEAESPAGR